MHLDVTSESDWQTAVQTAVDKYGKLDVLVNNAGIIIQKSIEETTEEDWDRTLDVNLKGVFLGVKAAIPAMRQAGGGSIVNISSNVGLVGSTRASSSYIASKGGVRLFTKAAAIQHAKDGIRCNSIHPGAIETDMYRQSGVTGDPDYMGRIPLGRIGDTIDIANAVLFLASDESSYMTGSEMVIDGGVTAQ